MLPTVLSSENQITGNAKRVSSSLIPLYTQKRTPANLGFLLTTAITRISKQRSLIYFDFFLSLLLIRCLIKAARVVGGMSVWGLSLITPQTNYFPLPQRLGQTAQLRGEVWV